MTDIILKVENLEAHYGKIAALKGISFNVRMDQIVTLLGGNGAGKSTTLKHFLVLCARQAGR